MKILGKISMGIMVAFLLGACSSLDTGGFDHKKEVEQSKVVNGGYTLDYSFFKRNGLPIPDNYESRGAAYLTARNDTLRKHGYDFFEVYNEDRALKFYKDLEVEGYGDNSPYWRWKIQLSKDDFFKGIKNNLPKVYKGRPRDVMTLSDGKWKSLNITPSSIGEIKNVEIAARGKSGIATYVLITTNKNKYLVAKELNIRKLFAFNKVSTGSDGDIHLYGAKGGNNKYIQNPIRKNLTLLPSGYFALEYSMGKVTIYGGGNGHGVGMSQFAAYDLAVNHGYRYDKILARNYPNSKLHNMYSLKGVGKTINVGITTPGGWLDHNNVILVSNGKMKIKGAGFSIDVPVRQKVVIVNKGNQLWVSVNGKHRVKTVNPLDITAHGYYITLEGLRRMHTMSPQYRGDMVIKPSNTNSTRIRVINRVKIEDYLKQVVPSEMPQSFGLEALKAQAVAARTYALSDYLKDRYRKDGFHVKDTTESQVYNNQRENEDASKAVELTVGKVLLHNGKPIDAKYFSTSSGFTEASNYVW